MLYKKLICGQSVISGKWSRVNDADVSDGYTCASSATGTVAGPEEPDANESYQS
eukprot:CAMPEP_0174982522 /NCGR_PEP_ID=MMETSP0004_2-20121128/16558_1 /TAXON_ID=420556 /ORGANISM="Ochromonas sp., Strain CCMP1393" /LENGTH=53 /DNA_ID=CAMNT_0016234519 /DNA_START=199 /DNA_END=360 /DNA_ORIENTATION=-